MTTIPKVTEEMNAQVEGEARNPDFTENIFKRLKAENPAIAAFMLAYKDAQEGNWDVVEPAAVAYRMLELASQRSD